jgi:hypothetical protein
MGHSRGSHSGGRPAPLTRLGPPNIGADLPAAAPVDAGKLPRRRGESREPQFRALLLTCDDDFRPKPASQQRPRTIRQPRPCGAFARRPLA